MHGNVVTLSKHCHVTAKFIVYSDLRIRIESAERSPKDLQALPAHHLQWRCLENISISFNDDRALIMINSIIFTRIGIDASEEHLMVQS